jgi:hypothetical protein
MQETEIRKIKISGKRYSVRLNGEIQEKSQPAHSGTEISWKMFKN